MLLYNISIAIISVYIITIFFNMQYFSCPVYRKISKIFEKLCFNISYCFYSFFPQKRTPLFTKSIPRFQEFYYIKILIYYLLFLFFIHTANAVLSPVCGIGSGAIVLSGLGVGSGVGSGTSSFFNIIEGETSDVTFLVFPSVPV